MKKEPYSLKTILNRLAEAPKYSDDMASSRFGVYSDCFDMANWSSVITENEKSFVWSKVLQSMIATNDHNSAMFKVIQRNHDELFNQTFETKKAGQ